MDILKFKRDQYDANNNNTRVNNLSNYSKLSNDVNQYKQAYNNMKTNQRSPINMNIHIE